MDLTLGSVVFADTSALVTLHNHCDTLHARAKAAVLAGAAKQVFYFTSNYIVAETVTVLSQRVSHRVAVDFYEQAQRELTIIRISQEIEERAFVIFKKLRSKNVSFVDCTSFALLRELGFKTVFSFDKDFIRQGFKLLG